MFIHVIIYVHKYIRMLTLAPEYKRRDTDSIGTKPLILLLDVVLVIVLIPLELCQNNSYLIIN